jgi:aryl-alcohol dehydrogenase-like predicted oxidoreductase
MNANSNISKRGVNVKSRLVLGTANYGKLSQGEVNKLLGTANELGINRIDTAYGYENSEYRIGRFLKSNKDFEVNTKVGLPNPNVFTPSGIRLTLETSLKRLGLDCLGTLFVHSLPAIYLTHENISAMVKLKTEGKIKRIGYAGDGNSLGTAVSISEIDDFMATFNIIDQSNLREIRRLSSTSEIYYKLVMAQAIWTSLKLERRLKGNKFVRLLFNKPPEPETWIDYCSRFRLFRSEFDGEDFAKIFLRYALFSGSAKQYVVLGTVNCQHIRNAVEIEQEPVDSKSIHVTKYESIWARKSLPTWEAHNG